MRKLSIRFTKCSGCPKDVTACPTCIHSQTDTIITDISTIPLGCVPCFNQAYFTATDLVECYGCSKYTTLIRAFLAQTVTIFRTAHETSVINHNHAITYDCPAPDFLRYCDTCGKACTYENLSYVKLPDGTTLARCVDCVYDYYLCAVCGLLCVSSHVHTTIGGEKVCLEHSDYDNCFCCNSLVHESDLTAHWYKTEDRTVYICETCLDTEIIYCEDCGEPLLAHMDRIYYIYSPDCPDNYRVLCNDCFESSDTERCFNCGHDYDREYLTIAGGRYICPHCIDYYTYCPNCRRLVYNDDILEYDDGFECCKHCDTSWIRAYSFKPDPIFHKSQGENGAIPFYGLELETDRYADKYQAARHLGALSRHGNVFYQKEDGSLDDGIELVFHPRSNSSWQEFSKDGLGEICQEVRDNGGRSWSTSTCGIHIHRSKTDLTDLDISKLVVGMVKFQHQIIKLAGRSSSYATFDVYHKIKRDYCVSNAKTGDKVFFKEMKKGFDSRLVYERYVALNLQPDNTIEFRVFKGTLSVDRIEAYLNFVHTFVSWVKDNSSIAQLVVQEPDILWKQYLAYVIKTGYTTLYKFFQHINLA